MPTVEARTAVTRDESDDVIRVIVTDPGGRRWVHAFPEATRVIHVGRSPDSDVQVDDRRASRRQLVLRRTRESWVVEDVSGRGSTKLNGIRLDAPTRLTHEDEVDFGRSALVITSAPRESDAAPTVGETWSGAAVSGARADIHLGSRSSVFQEAVELARRVAATSETILLRGETGTGKEVFTRLIHEMSSRSAGPLVAINCPGLPESLLESELFGVEKGVATGVDARPGRLAQAHSGTVLLDEIGDLPASAQAKLLRFLQTKTVDRVGGGAPIEVDVRVIAATNVNLEAAIEAGDFRADLYHRLAAFTITIPPLRERREDVPELLEHFLARSGTSTRFSDEAIRLLEHYSFPGNVRELELLVRQATVLANGELITPDDLPDRVRGTTASTPDARHAGVEERERLYQRVVDGGEDFWAAVREPFLRRELGRAPIRHLVARALDAGGGSYAGAARILGVDDEYRKFVDFLRHNRLRPEDR